MAQSNQLTQLPVTLEGYYKQTPTLPVGFRDFLVSIAPWVALIFGILGVLFGILGLGGSSVATGLGAGHYGLAAFVSSLGMIVSFALLLAAYPGLKDRKLVGWRRFFWSEIAWTIFALLADLVAMSLFGIVWTIICSAIALYFVFQMKPAYK
jgi:hypothetical protein